MLIIEMFKIYSINEASNQYLSLKNQTIMIPRCFKEVSTISFIKWQSKIDQSKIY